MQLPPELPPQLPSPGPPTPLEPPSTLGAPAPMLSAQEVHARTKADEELFNKVIDRLGGRLYAFAYAWLKSRAEVQDLMQNVLESAWDNDMVIQCGGDEARCWAYLRKAMRNALTNFWREHRRDRRKRSRYGRLVVRVMSYFATPDEDVIEHEIQWHADRLIGQLSPRCREVYELIRKQGFSRAEAAEMLGVSDETVKAHLRKAHRHMRKGLTALGYDCGLGGMGDEMEDTP